jgi:hypothetical protein
MTLDKPCPNADFSDEACQRLADDDGLENVVIHLRDALTSTLKAMAWPQTTMFGSVELSLLAGNQNHPLGG